MINAIKVIPASTKPAGINSFNMSVGQLGRVTDNSGSVANHIVMRSSNGVVDLTDPSYAWDVSFSAPTVTLLNPGDKLEITVGLDEISQREARRLRTVNKIEAIKYVRQITNWPLTETKEYVDSL